MIPFDNWGGIDQDAAQRIALDPTTRPMTYRLMFAALGWANLSGHAEFIAGDLARRLQVVARTGELVTPAANTLSNAIKEARDAGLIGKESTARCLTAPDWFAKTGGRGGRACKFHGIKAGRR